MWLFISDDPLPTGVAVWKIIIDAVCICGWVCINIYLCKGDNVWYETVATAIESVKLYYNDERFALRAMGKKSELV